MVGAAGKDDLRRASRRRRRLMCGVRTRHRAFCQNLSGDFSANIPVVGKEYNCFDDGKIRESRQYKVTVVELIPFSKINTSTLEIWKSETEECPWLYNKTTDFFAVGVNTTGQKEFFVRTTENMWFGLRGSLDCGVLDIDGCLAKQLET